MSIDMIRAFKTMIAALVMLVVAGCKMNLTADIYRPICAIQQRAPKD